MNMIYIDINFYLIHIDISPRRAQYASECYCALRAKPMDKQATALFIQKHKAEFTTDLP